MVSCSLGVEDVPVDVGGTVGTAETVDGTVGIAETVDGTVGTAETVDAGTDEEGP